MDRSGATGRAQWRFDDGPEKSVIVLSGDWLTGDVLRLGPAPPCMLNQAPKSRLSFDTTDLKHWDTRLIALLLELKRSASRKQIDVDWSGLPASAIKLLDLIAPEQPEKPAAGRPGLLPLTRIGHLSLQGLAEIGATARLAAALFGSVGRICLGRAQLRFMDVVSDGFAAGPASLLIVGIVNFLVGATLAFVGAAQLRRFGAESFTANLVGVTAVREMAAVMTAIVMAGRTGGAYAASIASMRGNEELDALDVIGISLSDYIVFPSVAALAITMPMLYVFGAGVSILGGMAIASSALNLSATGFLRAVVDAVGLDNFIFGLLKSFVFALLIGIISCRIGLKAGRSASDVGNAATQAVVACIIGIIAVDATCAVLAEMIGI